MNQVLIGPLLRHVGTSTATVWVETDEPFEVAVLACRERTWTIAGHHYAMVSIDGLAPGTSTPYDVRLDGEVVWPPEDSGRPHCRIRTLAEDRPVRIAFGSCRYARAAEVADDDHFDADSLVCYSRKIAALWQEQWPDAFLMLGDQVYADETSEATKRRIRARRDITTGSGEQVADFEEYTWLYAESWTDPDVRWLMSTVATSMIFDDHDVRDDWNPSHAWREDMKETSWWQERVVGALSWYWVYRHLGNLSTTELAENELYQRIRAGAGDIEAQLREFAATADREADGAKGARWSYRHDLGKVRLLMIDSRCGRILAEAARSTISESEFDWINEQMQGDYDHLLIGTSLPWLLPRALHDIESWNEVLCTGARGPRVARWARRCAVRPIWSTGRPSANPSTVSLRCWPLSGVVSDLGRAALPRPRCVCCPAMCTMPTPPRRTTATTSTPGSTN